MTKVSEAPRVNRLPSDVTFINVPDLSRKIESSPFRFSFLGEIGQMASQWHEVLSGMPKHRRDVLNGDRHNDIYVMKLPDNKGLQRAGGLVTIDAAIIRKGPLYSSRREFSGRIDIMYHMPGVNYNQVSLEGNGQTNFGIDSNPRMDLFHRLNTRQTLITDIRQMFSILATAEFADACLATVTGESSKADKIREIQQSFITMVPVTLTQGDPLLKPEIRAILPVSQA